MKKIKSALVVIATAIEKDTEALKKFLRNNGIAVNSNATKNELKIILTTALANSKSFAENFKKWVQERYNSNFNNSVGDGIGYTFGSSGVFGQTTNPLSTNTVPAITTTDIKPTTTQQTNESSFWKDVNFNTILDFTKDSLNNYVALQNSKTEQAIVDAALQKELLAQQSSSTSSNQLGQKSMPTWAIVTLSIIGISIVGYGVYQLTKKK